MPYSRHSPTRAPLTPTSAARTLRTSCTLLIIFILGLVAVEAAPASWGVNSCSHTNHCYATVEQTISGTGAYVRVTTQGNTEPCWETGCFTTNELWVSFPGRNGWIEVGEMGGYGEGERTRHRFYGEQYPGSPFYIEVAPAEVPLNEAQLYGIAQCRDGSGYWCVTWNGAEVHRFGGWPRTYALREFGVEVASDVMPGTWGYAEGVEGDGAPWSGGVESFVDPGMGAALCEFWREGVPYTQPNCLHWEMGSGPHDRLAAGATRRDWSTQPHPRRAAGEIYGRHHLISHQPEGATELWVGARRPNRQERTQRW